MPDEKIEMISINKTVVNERLFIIEGCLNRLRQFQLISLEEFEKGDNFAIAEHYLRRALEASLEIGTHILSRLPGVKPQSYKDIALLLGENNVLPLDFAKEKFEKMAGFRNRLIHFYPKVTSHELYTIIQNELPDLEKFCQHIVKYIEKI